MKWKRLSGKTRTGPRPTTNASRRGRSDRSKSGFKRYVRILTSLSIRLETVNLDAKCERFVQEDVIELS